MVSGDKPSRITAAGSRRRPFSWQFRADTSSQVPFFKEGVQL